MKSLADQDFGEGLVEAMRERLPKGVNLAHHLMDLLCLGKESVYRRLRGEVPFTFNEVVFLAKHFNISLDGIMGETVSNGAMFNLQLIATDDEFENYCEIQNYYSNIFSYIAKDPMSELTMACNTIPYSLYPGFGYLTRYRLCRWMYHNDKLSLPTKLDDIVVPKKLIEVQEKLASSIRDINSVSFIWDCNVLKSYIREIEYFRALRMLTDGDLDKLKREMLVLLDELEKMTIEGHNSDGKKVSVYLSNIDFESSYGYAEREGFQICFFRIHLINSFDSQQKQICEAQKSWIRALKRHSTLISQSGEVERIKFFAEHRALVNALGSE
ncbi:MAG: hypothetical protein LIO85_02055 [Rikenellaceae bacterium]|nr:hypothetical protein [Rikenellaceae bacterium]